MQKQTPCFKFNIFSVSNPIQLFSILNKTIPASLCIDIALKRPKIHPPYEIDLSTFNHCNCMQTLWLKGSSTRSTKINVTVPTTSKRVSINAQAYKIVNGTNIEEFATTTYDSFYNPDFSTFGNLKYLFYNEERMIKLLDLSPLHNLQRCNLKTVASTIIFPNHKIELGILDCVETEILQNNQSQKKAKKFQQQQPPPTSNIMFHLSDFSQLQTVVFEKEIIVSALPSTLQTLKLLECPSHQLTNAQQLILPLKQLKKITIPSGLLEHIKHIKTLTEINVVSNRDEFSYTKSKPMSFKSLKQLKKFSLNSCVPIPILPTSLVDLEILNYDSYSTPEVHLDYLTNLNTLSLFNGGEVITFPTSLTNLKLKTSDKTKFTIKDLPLKHLHLMYETRGRSKAIELPNTLESLDFDISGKTMLPLNLRNFTNLSTLTCSYKNDSAKDVTLENFYLPPSLKNASFEKEGHINFKFENTNNIKLFVKTKRTPRGGWYLVGI
ncbi:hypothetical protein QTN25_006385 [Entamoeba marina]